MVFRDIKYLAAYLIPALAAWGLYQQGWASWLTVVVIFGVMPVLEMILPKSARNVPEEEEPSRSSRIVFDWLLYLNIPMVYGLVVAYAWVVSASALSIFEWIGLTLSVGVVVGANGINVAHELGHRSNAVEQWLAKLLLLPALYQHFFIEHNYGHHKHVATPADPATARLGQSVYAFWWQSVVGGYLSAWTIQRDLLRRAGKGFWSLQNEMLLYALLQIAWVAMFVVVWNWTVAIYVVAVSTVGFLLLETVNYIEHYGLQRRQMAQGRFEPVLPVHSWNSDHEMGRILLYELTRHSDHHYKSTRKYQILRHLDESPNLPLGYPGSMLLSLVPPLWFWWMNPRAEAAQARLNAF
jgi:alkane 1-monooxygenase